MNGTRQEAGEGLIAAVVRRRGRFFVGEPLFTRAGQIGLRGKGPRIGDGDLVIARPLGRGARIERVIGRPDRAADVLDALVWERVGHRGFRPEVRAAADIAPVGAENVAPREDLRDLPTFTVDPATARDFDDAVSARQEPGQIRLWVHIADVAAHVRPGDALDREAARRGTSVYVPGSVEPMLPANLSEDACSLSPNQDRLAVTTRFAVRDDGEVVDVSFSRSVMRSDARLNYDQLDEVFAGHRPAPGSVAEPIDLARRAAAILADQRSSSALVVLSAEPEFEFSDRDVVGARAVVQTEAHRLIEHLMICTNERVAEHCERRGAPILYRVHEHPDPTRIEWLIEQLASLDLPTPAMPKPLGPTQAGAIAAEASRLVSDEAKRRGHGREAYTTFVLRALKQASYSDRNLGHAGLASTAYAHFTSPIRRYPDLIVHRGLLGTLGLGELPPTPSAVAPLGAQCSERERDAMRVERNADAICLAFLLDAELRGGGLDHSFEGEISGVIGAGAFVRFAGVMSDAYEGLVPVRQMPGDHFDLNSTETALVGRKTGRSIRIGDPLTVRVTRVEAPRGRVDLTL